MVKGTSGPAVTKATPGISFARIQSLLARPGLSHGVVMFAALSLANVLDYAYNVAMGRLLSAEGYGILVALQAILRVVSVSLEIVRTVTARYVVDFMAQARRTRAGMFLRAALRQATLWGVVAALLFAALSRPIARALQLPAVAPVLVVAFSLLPLMIKPVIGGALQGAQQFTGLGIFQAAHAAFRLAAGLVLVRLGLDAVGALAALPIGTLGTLLLGCGLLWGLLRQPGLAGDGTSASGFGFLASLVRYTGKTTIGLLSFAVLVNMDALVVKHYATPVTAGHYSLVVTLGKIVLFLPVAFAQVLFSKSAERYVQRRDSSRLLRLSQVMTVLPCTALTVAYFVGSDAILRLVFGVQNPFTGPVLGLIALAMTGYALVNVWLNYFLSVEQPGFVYAVLASVIVQFALLTLFHASLLQVVTVVAGTSVGLFVTGEVWFRLARAR